MGGFEDALKKTVLQAVKRGRVDVFITAEREAAFPKNVTVNFALADAYLEAAEQLKQRYGMAGQVELKDLLELPELIQMKDVRQEPDDEIEQELCACLEQAVAQLSAMRRREGAFLEQDIRERISEMKRIHVELEALLLKSFRSMRRR